MLVLVNIVGSCSAINPISLMVDAYRVMVQSDGGMVNNLSVTETVFNFLSL